MLILYNFKIFKCCFVVDVDDDNFSNEQIYLFFYLRVKKIRLKNFIMVRKIKMFLEKNIKIFLGECDEGRKLIE